MSEGWLGVELPPWPSAMGRTVKRGWDFFDARGNQGHMYAYFRFYADDLTLVYPERVVAYGNGTEPNARRARTDKARARVDDRAPTAILAEPRQLALATAAHSQSKAPDALLAKAAYAAYPCPFLPPGKDKDDVNLAYYHFTGNKKPWTTYDPTDPKYAQWYRVLADIGIDVQHVLFSEK